METVTWEEIEEKMSVYQEILVKKDHEIEQLSVENARLKTRLSSLLDGLRAGVVPADVEELIWDSITKPTLLLIVTWTDVQKIIEMDGRFFFFLPSC